jgi:formate hydrogenlyase subunit 4
MSDVVDKYIETHSKSQALSFFLTFFLGPLGLFYSSWVGALILIVIAIASISTIVVPIICWVLSMIIGFSAVSKHNDKIKAAAELGVRE